MALKIWQREHLNLIWRQLAAEGNADAQYALGVVYFKGEGVSRDLNDSMKWFEQAANSGNVQHDDGRNGYVTAE